METGIVFNLQKCSIHDGPGIRTLVFLKGCPLACAWCSNPESQGTAPEIASFPSRCIGCRACQEACPEGAIVQDGARLRTDPARCGTCMACAGACYAGSRQVVGRAMTTAEVMAEVLKDRTFYKHSGGGVTFSGGEPLMQPAFLLELLGECRRHGVGTALETTAHGSFGALREAARLLDTIYIDIKHMDPHRHRQLTGVANTLILDNIRKLDGEGKRFVVRIPVVPGCNDGPGEIEATARFCLELESVAAIELLPYHPLGEPKYRSLDRDYPLKGLEAPGGQRMGAIRDAVAGIVASRRIPCAVVHG
jgi:pyruvate formate lyase activating enzyme